MAARAAFIGRLKFLGWAILYHSHSYRSNYPKFVVERREPAGIEDQRRPADGILFSAYRGTGLLDLIWVAFCGDGSLVLDWLPLAARDQTPDTPEPIAR